MYMRFYEMFRRYGPLAAYLLMRIETKTLTETDVKLAWEALATTSSALVKVLGGTLETPPDLGFLTREGAQAIMFDLNMNAKEIEDYLEQLGYIEKKGG